MLVTGVVFSLLLLATIVVMAAYVAFVFLEAIATKLDRPYRRLLRKLTAERYLQMVLLPLYGAIVGGLFSTAISILVGYPSSRSNSSAIVAYILLVCGLVFGAAAPLATSALYANPKNLLLGMRIDRLKNGDWTQDTKTDVIMTIEKNRAAITKKLNSNGIWFLALLALLIVSDIGSLILAHRAHWVLIGITEAVVIAAILGGLVARYRVRQIPLRNELTELGSYQEEADKLSPPASTTPPSQASAVHHQNHHDLWVAVGGLLVGAVLARFGAVRSRGKRRS